MDKTPMIQTKMVKKKTQEKEIVTEDEEIVSEDKRTIDNDGMLLMPTEWARTSKKNEKLYLYHDKALGLITKSEFERIEV